MVGNPPPARTDDLLSTLHVARCTMHVARRTWHVAPGTWHDTFFSTCQPLALYVFVNPFRPLVTVNEPSGCALTLIQDAGPL